MTGRSTEETAALRHYNKGRRNEGLDPRGQLESERASEAGLQAVLPIVCSPLPLSSGGGGSSNSEREGALNEWVTGRS